jgi:hypothetical protein
MLNTVDAAFFGPERYTVTFVGVCENGNIINKLRE